LVEAFSRAGAEISAIRTLAPSLAKRIHVSSPIPLVECKQGFKKGVIEGQENRSIHANWLRAYTKLNFLCQLHCKIPGFWEIRGPATEARMMHGHVNFLESSH